MAVDQIIDGVIYLGHEAEAGLSQRGRNSSGGSLTIGSVVTLSHGQTEDPFDFAFTTTTTLGDEGVIGVLTSAVSDNRVGSAQVRGHIGMVKVNGTTNIAVGDWLESYSSAGIAAKSASAHGVFARALEAYTTDDSAGEIKAIIMQPPGMRRLNDSVKLHFGTGRDAYIEYDGTNMYINPRLVGSGSVISQGNVVVQDDLLLSLGTGSDSVILNRSTALSADAELDNVIEGTSDHPGVAANSLIISNITNDGDIMFAVSDNGHSKGLLKLNGADGSIEIHGGSIIPTVTNTVDLGTASLEFKDAYFDGTVTADAFSGPVSTATVATTVTITDNESTNENNAIIFTAGGDLDGGNLGLESDGDLYYNPSTGIVTTTGVILGGGGINFPDSPTLVADQNTLDDYEQPAPTSSNFTPQIADSSGDGTGESQTYNRQYGTYTKIGNRVFFNIDVRITNITGLEDEQVRVLGLPFTSNSTPQSRSAVTVTASALNISAGQVVTGTVYEDTAHVGLQLWDATGGVTDLLCSELATNSFIVISGHYTTES